MADDFEYLVQSLIETTSSALRQTSARGFWTEADKSAGTATLTISMVRDSWDDRADVLRKVSNVRCMYLDDFSLEFLFSEDAPSEDEIAPSDDRPFAYAS